MRDQSCASICTAFAMGHGTCARSARAGSCSSATVSSRASWRARTRRFPRCSRGARRAAGQAVEVLNLGIGATGLSDYLKLIQDAVPALAPDEVVLVFYANDFAGEPPFTPERIRPPFEPRYRPAWLPRIAQVARRLVAGEPVALRWHGEAEALPGRGARSVESVDGARRRVGAEGRSRHRRRDAPRDVQPLRRRRARRIRLSIPEGRRRDGAPHVSARLPGGARRPACGSPICPIRDRCRTTTSRSSTASAGAR